MKQYHYEFVSDLLYRKGKSQIAFIVGLQGSFGKKEYYSKESILVLLNSKAV
jgi:hypothetical protein